MSDFQRNKFGDFMRLINFWNLSAETDVAFILGLEHRMKPFVPLKVTHAAEQIW